MRGLVDPRQRTIASRAESTDRWRSKLAFYGRVRNGRGWLAFSQTSLGPAHAADALFTSLERIGRSAWSPVSLVDVILPWSKTCRETLSFFHVHMVRLRATTCSGSFTSRHFLSCVSNFLEARSNRRIGGSVNAARTGGTSPLLSIIAITVTPMQAVALYGNKFAPNMQLAWL